MDGQTRFLKIAELKREMHAEGCTDERGLAILAEIRALDKPIKAKRQPKAPKEQYMTVLGGYVLDMHNHGRLIGHRDEYGEIVRTR
jgi:hypothetical protein